MTAITDFMITKRDGRLEKFTMSKMHRVLEWASDGLKFAPPSQIEMFAQSNIYNGITTRDLHKAFVMSAGDLINKHHPDYQYAAARLNIFYLRKEAYGKFIPPHLYDHTKKHTKLNVYTDELLQEYSKEDFDFLNYRIVHDRDMSLTYAATKQFEMKYLVSNRKTGQIYETPQMAYMLIAMTLYLSDKSTDRLQKIAELYDLVSTFKISFPTPIMAGARTRTKQFSSCVLIECDDSLDSIIATDAASMLYVARKAGIGINAGRIRAEGSEVRGGESLHTGCIPFYQKFQQTIGSCSQGGVRKGSATLFYPMWHLEFPSLVKLKDSRGTEHSQAPHLDYGVQINGLMYQRLKEGKPITLFSPNDVPGLYDAFFSDQKEFARLYEKYEADSSIRKKAVPAIELFGLLINQRSNTGRIYIQHVDHSNTHSAFDSYLAPIRQSNLCMEITLPTKPVSLENPDQGEIALCTLASINLGEVNDLSELEKSCYALVRMLDNLLTYQDYPVKIAEKSAQNRRALGIGVTNLAYYLAKNNMKYSDGSGNDLVHKTFEAIQYYCLKASNKLAMDRGVCGDFQETTYAKGILPIDTYARKVDDFCDTKLQLDWESLRADIKKYGLRNSTLTAIMPSETSSQISNSTNGVEPPRSLVVKKGSKNGRFSQVVPDIQKLEDKYELAWNMPNNEGYLQLMAIIQKFIDQSISTNLYYNMEKNFKEGEIPLKVLLGDIVKSYAYGLKTLYYQHNHTSGTISGSSDSDLKKDDGILIEDEAECASCVN